MVPAAFLHIAVEVIIKIIGILEASDTYVSFDPTYPAARLQYMPNHSRVPVVLTQAALVAHVRPAGTWHTTQVFCLDADSHTLPAQPTTIPSARYGTKLFAPCGSE